MQAQDVLFQEGGTFFPYQEDWRRVLSGRITGIKPLGEDCIRWHLVDVRQ